MDRKLEVLFADIRETYQELHDADDTLDHDEIFEELMIDLTAHLISISRGPGEDSPGRPIEEVLAIAFGVISAYGFDPDLHEVLKERIQ